MREYKSEKRLNKITTVANSRQFSFKVIIENIHDPHNVSAIFRTCDAAGVPKVSLIYTDQKFPKIGKKSSASAFKWVEKEKYSSVTDCYKQLRRDGFKIYASALTENAISLYDIDLSERCAVVLGNEHQGVSNEAAEQSDACFRIPQFGMVQSLNVSVANGIILSEMMRQRLLKGMYDDGSKPGEEIEKLIDKWCNK